jgi:hypothetical protein
LIRGKTRKVYVLRYYEPVVLSDGKLSGTRRSVALGAVSEIGIKKQAYLVADSILRRAAIWTQIQESVEQASPLIH